MFDQLCLIVGQEDVQLSQVEHVQSGVSRCV
jgi:hypothetical protein